MDIHTVINKQAPALYFTMMQSRIAFVVFDSDFYVDIRAELIRKAIGGRGALKGVSNDFIFDVDNNALFEIAVYEKIMDLLKWNDKSELLNLILKEDKKSIEFLLSMAVSYFEIWTLTNWHKWLSKHGGNT